MELREVRLSDRFDVGEREILLSGVQALVRLPLAQRARDAARGWNTGGYVTGYRGSPLGGLDMQVRQAVAAYAAAGVVFNPGINEDLAATAIWGAQQSALRGEGTRDGVFGLWYGKGPGVDRSGDVFRHANFAGTAPRGGVLCALGDDHTGESSTTCHQTELALMDAMMPILAPAGVQEVLDFGLAGWALSRFSGCWVGLKCVKDTIEVTEVVDGDPHRLAFLDPDDFDSPAGGLSIRLADWPVAQEARMHEHKHRAVLAFARANDVNDRRVGRAGARFGIVAAGKAWLDVVHALALLGVDEERASALGITAYKVGLVWPLEPEGIARFAKGLDRIVVVEEKRAVLEAGVKEALYGLAGTQPRVAGKFDDEGNVLFPVPMDLDPVSIAAALAGQLDSAGVADDAIRERGAACAQALGRGEAPVAVRNPWFCAGCPHNTSTRVPDGSRAYAGIGCHYMVQWMDRETLGFTHMGGEGANWVGEAPFSKRPHVFQNMGDGTFNHSGSMAVRAAVAAGVNMTFKVLFNDAVAMTGGQRNDGGLDPARVAWICRAEGVKRISVVAADPGAQERSAFPPETTFHHRRDLDAVQRELRDIRGASLLLFVQTCAAENRRRRRRGEAPDPDRRVFINPFVCEGCGDCGVASNCVAVRPLETPFGRKREIDQSSCNKDYSCLDGFCPSFVTLEGAKPRAGGVGAFEPPPVPEPATPALDRNWSILATGIGGTGVVTVGAILGMAAHLEGKACAVMEMAGLAQKGGAVVVHCRLAPTPDRIDAVRIALKEADAVLGGDLVVTGSAGALGAFDSERTAVVCNSHATPTGEVVLEPDLHLPTRRLQEAVRRHAAPGRSWFLDATRLANALAGDSIFANMLLLGAAWQHGYVPLSRAAIRRAVEVNGVAIDRNLRAFEIGRWAAAEPVAAAAAIEEESVEEEFAEAFARRRAFLAESRDEACASRYASLVERSGRVERERAPGCEGLAEAVMRGYFQLLAYKDEYEVARLHLGTADMVRARFEGVRRMRFHLAPPILVRRDGNGRIRKRTFGPWVLFAFRVLARMKPLRGTAFDPFGRTAERRMERRLIAEYEETMDEILGNLSARSHEAARGLAALPLEIRGYGHVKARNAEAASVRRKELLAELRSDDPIREVPRAAA